MSEIVIREEYQLFGIKATNSEIIVMREKFEPLNEMWTAINNFMKKIKTYMDLRLE